MHECEHCSKSFFKRGVLLQHVRRIHNVSNVKKDPNIVCEHCLKTFSARRSLKQHLKVIHKEEVPKENKMAKIKCPVYCSAMFFKIEDLQVHVDSEHQIQLQKDRLQFTNFEEFSRWLAEEEKRTASRYVRHQQIQRTKRHNKYSFFCSRSGYHVPKGTGKRRLKTQGSSKIGCYCPSSLSVLETADFVKVAYCKTHYGHDNSIEHLQPSVGYRRKIAAGKAMAGLSADDVLKACSEPNPSTKDFIFQQTMYRIKDPKASLDFYTRVLGMRLLFKRDFPAMKFSLYFMGYENKEDIPKDDKASVEWGLSRKATLELTHNWGTENDPSFTYHNGNSDPRGYGHIGIMVPDVAKACARFEDLGVKFVKRLTDGTMKTIAFIQDPDGYWIEIFNNRGV